MTALQLLLPSILLSIALIVSARDHGELICRKCGHSVTRASELVNVTTEDELIKYSYAFPVVGKTANVHVFDNPAGERFHMLSSKTANLKFAGEASSDATWFPGMQWTICVCSHCGQHMGWYFQPEKASVQEKEAKGFVGLVLDHIISADYADSLVKIPA